ncbi:MAG TPA: rod shape-determining protein MreD [Oceanithermus profundus]|uniref:Rod shape-determining protein MreD n=1 Tax=Oceanithermus profundus TaxID=187137 RepID=A0A7C4VHR9_9DEIN|nr:rod shape-determining protein MreD [Oceanithermus profundus]
MNAFLLVVFSLILQALVSGLLPERFSPPDLWFLLAVVLASRQNPYLGLATAFGLGLLQDLSSAGYLGFHALGLASAAYAFYGLRGWLHWEEPAARMVILALAFLAKWGGYLILVYWMRYATLPASTWLQVFLPELVLTLLLAPIYLRLAEALLGPGDEAYA